MSYSTRRGLLIGRELGHTDVVKNMGGAERTEGSARTGAALTPVGHELGSETGTRARVARLILEHGPITASALGERLGLTPAAIRRHLDNLVSEGMVEARDAHPVRRRRRGRPARVFVITGAGRDAFVHGYDDLAASALRFLAEKAGPQAVAEFAQRQVAELERRYRPLLADAPPHQRVRLLAEALSNDGYAASAGAAPAEGSSCASTTAQSPTWRLNSLNCATQKSRLLPDFLALRCVALPPSRTAIASAPPTSALVTSAP